jgi:Na+/melibiose symporter-like transporter
MRQSLVWKLGLGAFMPNLWSTALVVFGFYTAYYFYEPPYRGLYPDLVPESHFGRAQSVQHLFRGAALGIGMLCANELFKVWRPAPFLLAAVVTTAACGGCVLLVREPAGGADSRVFAGVRSYLSTSWCILREEPEVRRFLIANAAWEGVFAAARTFVVLYITRGLREPHSVVTGVLACVAAGYVAAAIFSGRIGDRLGVARVIFLCLFVYAGGLLVAGFARTWHDYYYGLIFPVSVAAGTVMTLAWALLFKLMPPRHRGVISGLALGTKGVGLLFAIVAGFAIDRLSGVFASTDGYQALWPVCALPILGSIPLVARLLRAEPSGKPEPQLG